MRFNPTTVDSLTLQKNLQERPRYLQDTRNFEKSSHTRFMNQTFFDTQQQFNQHQLDKFATRNIQEDRTFVSAK